jgi:hypothetical protein
VLLSRSLAQHRGKKCPYCGVGFVIWPPNHPHAPSRDHIRPQWDGGVLKIVVCRRCNSDKGGLFLSQWLVNLRADNDPRVEHVEKVAANHPFMARPSGRTHPSEPRPDDGRRTDAEALLDQLRNGDVTPQEAMRKAVLEAARLKDLPCGMCKRTFPSVMALEQHARVKHGTARPKIADPTEKR